MPGSGQWVEVSTATSPPELLGDWVSDKSIYTLVFWSKRFAAESQLQSVHDPTDVEVLSRLLKKPDFS